MGDTGDEDGVAEALVAHGPIAVAINATMGLQMYTGGIYNGGLLFKCSSDLKKLNHGVLAVGFGKGFWIVKNSWGASWGEKGYFRLKRGKNLCGIANCASYPTIVPPNPK